jgi:phosphatidylglycerol---prolipoprotein diacylglyceryl transferase
MLPTLSLGPLVLPTAPLLLIIGAWLSLWLLERSAQSLGLNHEAVYSLGVVGLLAGFVGARVAFVLLYWEAYQQDWLGIIWPLHTGYLPLAGLVIGGVGAFFYGRFYQLPALATFDALTPGLVVGLMAISLADFLGWGGFGTVTAVPWAITQFGLQRHPVQVYELLGGLLALAVWWRLLIRRRFEGELFLVTTAVYSATRLFVEAFRDDALLTGGGYRLIQIISLVVLLACFYTLRQLAPEETARET